MTELELATAARTHGILLEVSGPGCHSYYHKGRVVTIDQCPGETLEESLIIIREPTADERRALKGPRLGRVEEGPDYEGMTLAKQEASGEAL